jgi:hypothetical protein
MRKQLALLSAIVLFATTVGAVAQDNQDNPDRVRTESLSARQKTKLPLNEAEPPYHYRPCPADVVTPKGRHECLG